MCNCDAEISPTRTKICLVWNGKKPRKGFEWKTGKMTTTHDLQNIEWFSADLDAKLIAAVTETASNH